MEVRIWNGLNHCFIQRKHVSVQQMIEKISTASDGRSIDDLSDPQSERISKRNHMQRLRYDTIEINIFVHTLYI